VGHSFLKKAPPGGYDSMDSYWGECCNNTILPIGDNCV
jgi:hypothetical protein